MYRTLHKQRRDRALDLLLSLKKTVRDSGHQSEDFLYVFPWGNFGEYTYILALLPALRQRFKICLVVKESKVWMVKYFPTSCDFIVKIPDVYDDLYEELFEISSMTAGCPYVVFTDALANGRFNSELVVRSDRLTLAESYAFGLELPLETPLTPMSLAQRGPSLLANRATMAERGTGYTLLVPTANTIKNLEPAFWLALYRHLVAYGANPILDTTFVNWDVGPLKTIKLKQDELVEFVAQDCRALIGLRSGILDLLAGLARTTDLKIAALYPIESETYAPGTTGLTARGVARKGISIGRCWNAERVLDIETGPEFDAATFGTELWQFLR